jgi:hypothetical protein
VIGSSGPWPRRRECQPWLQAISCPDTAPMPRFPDALATPPLPVRIGPVEFGELGRMVAVRCPKELAHILKRARGVWEPGSRRWPSASHWAGDPRSRRRPIRCSAALDLSSSNEPGVPGQVAGTGIHFGCNCLYCPFRFQNASQRRTHASARHDDSVTAGITKRMTPQTAGAPDRITLRVTAHNDAVSSASSACGSCPADHLRHVGSGGPGARLSDLQVPPHLSE